MKFGLPSTNPTEPHLTVARTNRTCKWADR